LAARVELVRMRPTSKPTRKLHLAALRHFFDKLVQRHAVPLNPALSVRGPKHSVTEGKTPAMDVKQVRELLRSIPLTTKKGTPDLGGATVKSCVWRRRIQAAFDWMMPSWNRTPATTSPSSWLAFSFLQWRWAA